MKKLNNHKALIIFTRNPEIGKVKTRLAKTIGNLAALKVYRKLLEHTLHITRPLEVELCAAYAPVIYDILLMLLNYLLF